MAKVKRWVMISCAVGSIVIAGSGCAGWDDGACYNSIVIAYPNAEIRSIPGIRFRFLVRKPDGTVILVSTMANTNATITEEFVAFK